ncbi:MAG: glycosyltransferase family 39 protein [Terriglobia bacterium]|nr:glycosyltransferase family 39 protein [Terriglobia bacterium]
MKADLFHSEAAEPAHQTSQIALWISSAIFLVCYIGLTLKAALVTPLWMDEVLSVWASRFQSVTQIYAALTHGAQSAPPAYSVMLHYYSRIAGEGTLALRLPSIASVLLTGLVSFVLVRRHLGASSAIFASCLILETLSPYGLQVRPYAITTLCFALALLLWDDLNLRASLWRVVFIGLLLAIAVQFHFYCVLFVPCFGLIELLHTYRTRKVRYGLWIALLLAGTSIFIWLPLIHATSHFVAEDFGGSHAYGPYPTISYLIATYSYLFQGLADLHTFGSLGMNGCIVLTAMGLMGLGSIYDKLASRGQRSNSDVAVGIANRRMDFWEFVLGSILLPLIIFVFTLAVTKSFNVRYVIAGAIGASAILAEVLGGFPQFRRVVPVTLLIASLLMIRFGVPTIRTFDHTGVYKFLPGPYPIVVADGSQFFQLEESAPAQIRSRLVYLIVPSSVPVGDITNEHVIMRWKKINPKLPVENTAPFLAAHKKFYVLDERTSDDTPAVYLASEHLIDLWAQVNGGLIYRSHPSSSSETW